MHLVDPVDPGESQRLEEETHQSAPPDVVTREQRQAAQDFILNFRKTRMPYTLCQYILENSKNDYSLFQAATTIKEAIIRDWALMSSDSIEALRSFLLRYITNHITLQSFVREQILQTVAVILKRATLDKKGKSCDRLFEDVSTLISSGNITMQLVACSMLTSLLNEYSYTSRTSSVGLTWEFHIKCKRAFEQSDLKRVFMFSLQVLSEIETQPSPLSREATAFLNRILCIAEQVLSWEFTLRGVRMHTHAFNENPNAALKPPESWRDVLLDKNTLSLFFRIHQKARFNSDMAHHSMQCLVQLASLNGIIFSKDDQSQYLTHYIEGLLHMLSHIDLQEHENFGVASIFKNLLLMFTVQNFNSIDAFLFKSFIQTFTSLTCTVGRLAAQEESIHKDDTVFMESYEKLLESWACFTKDISSLPPGTLMTPATEIFNSYMQCHLSAPDGIRGLNVADSEDIDETEEDDRYKFSDQLSCIGTLGRIIPEHSVPLLSKVLEDRISHISNQLHRLQHQRDLASSHESTINIGTLHGLHEDLHWIILVTGHLLADDAEGETPTVPATIMKYSINQGKTVDVNLTMKMLTSAGYKLQPSEEHLVDSVIRLIAAVFRLCEVENQAVDAKLTDFLSPQVGSTVMWFLERWSDAYVLHDEMDYVEMSLALATAFGMDTEGVRWTMNFMLQKIVTTMSVWGSEPGLLTVTLKLLTDLAEQSSRAMYLSQSEVLWNLARLESRQEPPVSTLSPDARRQFMKAMVLVGCSIKDSTQEEQYWKLLLQSNHERFLHVVGSEGFKSGKEGSRQQFLYLLESLIGVATATQNSIAAEMFQFMAPLLSHVVKAIGLHHNYADVVTTCFELFSEVVAKMLPFLSTADSQTLYQLCLSAIQMFARHNFGRQCLSAEDEQETKFKDIILIMEMLTNLMSKDILDFSKDDQPEAGNCSIDGATVVIFGLELIVPLMNAEMLKFPSLCSCYFRLISFLSDLHSEKFCTLPEQLFNNIMASIELGFSSSGTDVTRMLFESLLALATHSLQNSQTSQHLQGMLGHFLKVIFRMLILDNFDLSLQEIGSTTLFCLICCNQDLYRDLVNQLIQLQPEEYKQRLLQAFNDLTPSSLQLCITRQNKITFRANFDVFLNNVRGFLCIK